MRLFMSTLLLTFFMFKTSQGQCNFKLDSQKILANSNLNALVKTIEKTNFNIKNNKQFIPSFIINEINCWLNKAFIYDSFRIANPGMRYNNTDLINPSLPNRKLMYLGISKNFMLLTYHYGAGIGAHFIMIVKFRDSRILDFWIGQAAKKKSKKTILTWLKKYKHDKQTELII